MIGIPSTTIRKKWQSPPSAAESPMRTIISYPQSRGSCLLEKTIKQVFKMKPLRLSEHALSQEWLAQFRNERDRLLAGQLLNRLKLVSAREFESTIENALIILQQRIQATLAVYPVVPPLPKDISGYDPFEGGILRNADQPSREAGRRRKFGSEDRVGHLLAKLQERFKRGSGASTIECTPTLKQLDSQGIRNIVFVDDVCGSGKRIADFWRSVPPRVKSLLSLGRYKLWIVLYAITPKGRLALAKALPNFPIDTNLITVLPTADLRALLTHDLKLLCTRYADSLGISSSGLGYRGSACPLVFEHGCPNNLPVILWKNWGRWRGIFPNRSIPTEIRSCFDQTGVERAAETLWDSQQPKLALAILDTLDQRRRLTVDESLTLTLLGLRLRGIRVSELPRRMLLSVPETKRLLRLAETMGLYEMADGRVSTLGREFVQRFRDQGQRDPRRRDLTIGRGAASYYPSQCEGVLR